METDASLAFWFLEKEKRTKNLWTEFVMPLHLTQFHNIPSMILGLHVF